MIPLARASLFRAAPALRRAPAVNLRARYSPILLQAHVRLAVRTASTTPDKKKKQEPEEGFLPAMSSARKEASAIASDLAKSIAGREPGRPRVREQAVTASEGQPLTEDFTAITASIASAVPKPVLYTGLAGAIPYLGTSLTTIYYARQAGLAFAGTAGATVNPEAAMAVLNACTHIQVTYGAVLLSFLGALHWGMEFAQFGGEQGYARLGLGIAPVAFAWSTLTLEPTLALAAQWAGFTFMWYADLQATNAGWTPRWYSQYRFYLSILIGTCMIATLAATNFFGAWTGASEHTKARDKISERQRSAPGVVIGRYSGAIDAVDGGEGGDAYVILKKKPEPEEPEEEAEPEEDAGDVSSGKGQADAPPEEKKAKQTEKDQAQDANSPDEMKQDTKK